MLKKIDKKYIKKGSTRKTSFKQDSKHKFQPNVPQKSAPNKSLAKWIFQEKASLESLNETDRPLGYLFSGHKDWLV